MSVQLIRGIRVDIEDEEVVEVHRLGRIRQDQRDNEGEGISRPRSILI